MFFALMFALSPLCAVAQSSDSPLPVMPAAEVDLQQLQWHARPVVVFADTPEDSRFIEQLELLAQRPEVLAERDVVVITDTDPAARTAIRLKLRPRGFMLVLIDKDGGVVFRKPFPWAVRELSRAIDKTPTRQRELREGATPGG